MRRLLVPVMLAAIGLAAACAPSQPTNPSAQGDPTASPDGSVAPSDGTETLGSTGIPGTALLIAEDVGSGYTAAQWDAALTDHGSLGMLMSYCGEATYSEAAEHTITVLAGSVGRGEQDFVHERITQYESSWAEHHMSDLLAVLPRCSRVGLGGGGGPVVTLTVIDTAFAGDGSLLVREERGAETQYHAVVRQGDVEAELRIHTGGDEAQARDIAAAAADRLCAASQAC